MVRVKENWTTIALKKETVELLKRLGRKGELYEDVVRRLLEKAGKTGN